MVNLVVQPKIQAEGYCCVYGYISLCRARGQSTKSMADWLKISHRTIKHQDTQVKRGACECQRYSTCMKPIIEEIKKGP